MPQQMLYAGVILLKFANSLFYCQLLLEKSTCSELQEIHRRLSDSPDDYKQYHCLNGNIYRHGKPMLRILHPFAKFFWKNSIALLQVDIPGYQKHSVS